MEKKYKHIEEEVRKTMGMADQIQRVEGNPFLATRVLQQVENESKPDHSFFSTLSPLYKIAFSVLLIAINALVIFQISDLGSASVQTENTIDIASEYGLVLEDSYELSYNFILEK